MTSSLRDTCTHLHASPTSAQVDRLEAIGEYALGIVHDFRNVLTVVLANASSLVSQHASVSEVPEELRDIMTAAHRGNEMIERLVRFARDEPSKAPMLSVQVLLETLPRQLCKLLPANIRLESDCPNLPFLVRAEASQIEEIVLNLATNGRDAMPDGGTLRLRANVRGRSEFPKAAAAGFEKCNAELVISVSDTGCGLDETTRRRMFEPFFTTKPAGQGLGIGLAMTRTLVSQLGGYIDVHTESDYGTTVSVVLPALRDNH